MPALASALAPALAPALVPVLEQMQQQCPIALANGIPMLRDDLSWAEGVPFHVMGALAQLQLGADALNLAGCRSGAVRIARSLREEGADFE